MKSITDAIKFPALLHLTGIASRRSSQQGVEYIVYSLLLVMVFSNTGSLILLQHLILVWKINMIYGALICFMLITISGGLMRGFKSELSIKLHCQYHINLLWLVTDTKWCHRSGSAFDQIMASCLMAPIHYLKLSLCIINGVNWHVAWVVSETMYMLWITAIHLKNVCWKLLPHLPEANWLTIQLVGTILHHHICIWSAKRSASTVQAWLLSKWTWLLMILNMSSMVKLLNSKWPKIWEKML